MARISFKVVSRDTIPSWPLMADGKTCLTHFQAVKRAEMGRNFAGNAELFKLTGVPTVDVYKKVANKGTHMIDAELVAPYAAWQSFNPRWLLCFNSDHQFLIFAAFRNEADYLAAQAIAIQTT